MPASSQESSDVSIHEEEIIPLGELITELDSLKESNTESSALKCPICSAVHPYKAATVSSRSNDGTITTMFKIFPASLHIPCCCGDLKGDADTTNNKRKRLCETENSGSVLTCGHAVCQGFHDPSKKKDQVPCPFPGCHSSTSATIDLNPPSMCSHNARVLRLVAANDAANTEQCPICWEEIDYEDLIALPCGHLLCALDFQKLGGKVGNDATLVLEELERRRERIEYLDGQFDDSLAQMVGFFRVVLNKEIDDEHTMEIATETISSLLALFTCAMSCVRENRGASVFVNEGGIKLVLQAMKRFPEWSLQCLAAGTLNALICQHHQERDARLQNATTLIEGGFLDIVREVLNKKDSRQQNVHEFAIFAERACYNFYNIFIENEYFVHHLDVFGLVVHDFIGAMGSLQEFPEFLSICMNVLSQILREERQKETSAKMRKEAVKVGSARACVTAMRAQPQTVEVQVSGIRLLSMLIDKETFQEVVDSESIECVAKAMRHFHNEPMVQRSGVGFVGNLGNSCQANEDLISFVREHDVVQRVQEIPLNHVEIPRLISASAAALSAIAENLPPLRIDIACTGFFDAYARALRSFHADLESFAYLLAGMNTLVKRLIADKRDSVVRLALCASDLIPAIKQSIDFSGWELLIKTVPAIAIRLCIADMDYQNFDNDVKEKCPIESPPFDVKQLLDKDLLADKAPGWYKGMSFSISKEHQDLRMKNKGSSFLLPSSTPSVGQEVRIRVRLPFGGRGYLYGKVTKVHPPLEKPSLQDQQSLVDAQEVTALVSLDSPHLERTLRYEPLPTFFLGEMQKFCAVLRWKRSTNEWLVQRLCLETTSNA